MTTEYSDAFTEFADGAPSAEPETDINSTEEFATEEVTDNVEQETDKVTSESEPENVWADAPEALKTEFEELQSKFNNLDHKYRSGEGRMAAIQRDHSRILRERDEFKQQLEEKPAANEAAETPKTYDEAKELFPDLISELETLRSIKNDVTHLKADREVDIALQQAGALQSIHPDYMQVASSSEFSQWLGSQSDYVHKVIRDNRDQIVNVSDVSDVMNRFKQSQVQEDHQSNLRELQKQSAATPPSKAIGNTPSGPSEDYSGAFAYFAGKT